MLDISILAQNGPSDPNGPFDQKKTVYLLRTSVSISLQANSYQLFFLALLRTQTNFMSTKLTSNVPPE